MILLALALIAATPPTLGTALATAAPGDTIVMTGDFGTVAIKGRTFAPPLTLDASAATVRFALDTVDGVNIVGGRTLGVFNDRSTGIGIKNSRNFSVDGYACDTARVCVGIGTSSDFIVNSVTVLRSQSDGVDIALSRRGRVIGTSCALTAIIDGAHPDCVQLWSRPEASPTADIVVAHTRAFGHTQIVSGFNHVRPDARGRPVDDGGFDRLMLDDNVGLIDMPDGVRIDDCRGCTFTNNHAWTLPGAPHYAQVVTFRFTGTSANNSGGPLPAGALPVGASAAAIVAAAAKP